MDDSYRWLSVVVIGSCVFLPGLALLWRARAWRSGSRTRAQRVGQASATGFPGQATETRGAAGRGITVQSYEDFMQAFQIEQRQRREVWWSDRRRDRALQVGESVASRLTDLEQRAEEQLKASAPWVSQPWTSPNSRAFLPPSSPTGPLVMLAKHKRVSGQRDEAIALLADWLDAAERGHMSVGEIEVKTMVEMLARLYRTGHRAMDACRLVDRWLSGNKGREHSACARALRVLLPQVLILCGRGVRAIEDDCRREGQRLLREWLAQANGVLAPSHPAVLNARAALEG